METIGELVRRASAELAAPFEAVPIPGALTYALGLPGRFEGPAAPVEPDRLDGRRIVVLAGPGVLAARGLVGLRELAEHAHLGVANTWGAKGVLAWDDPRHLGTCGLQARDFELLGLAGYELILATGIDTDETPEERFALAPVVHWDPRLLSELVPLAPRPVDPIPRTDLYARLAAVARPGYADDRFPRHPARAVMDLKRSLPPGALLTAEPGPVGLWVARTFPTDEPGSVIVPARAVPGIAAALALGAALHGRRAVAAVTEPVGETTRAAAELGARLGTPFHVVAWGDDVDLSLTDLLVEAAGPVVAWTGS